MKFFFIMAASVGVTTVFIYATNIGQLVHRSPDPNWWERIGRRKR